MRLDLHPGVVTVTLSRRNLQSLLVKLDQPWSRRAILSKNVHNELGELVAGLVLVVQAQEDEPHYSSREEPPGPMHPATEWALRRRNGDGR